MNHDKTDSSANNAEDCSWEGFFLYFFFLFAQLKTKCQIPVEAI